ncbi:hypothetical protein TYRP_019579 [Tyrophagus putrescentiae]|nr:hypothetical protein TYRP_019579 [Tyrophagus putrescentiae]
MSLKVRSSRMPSGQATFQPHFSRYVQQVCTASVLPTGVCHRLLTFLEGALDDGNESRGQLAAAEAIFLFGGSVRRGIDLQLSMPPKRFGPTGQSLDVDANFNFFDFFLNLCSLNLLFVDDQHAIVLVGTGKQRINHLQQTLVRRVIVRLISQQEHFSENVLVTGYLKSGLQEERLVSENSVEDTQLVFDGPNKVVVVGSIGGDFGADISYQFIASLHQSVQKVLHTFRICSSIDVLK